MRNVMTLLSLGRAAAWIQIDKKDKSFLSVEVYRSIHNMFHFKIHCMRKTVRLFLSLAENSRILYNILRTYIIPGDCGLNTEY